MPLLKRFGLRTPEVRAWAMYDWANSGMLTLVATAVFPVFFASAYVSGGAQAEATSRFTLATTIGLAIIAVASPFLGTLADYSAAKVRLLGGFMLLGVTATTALFFIGQGQWVFALVAFSLANIGLNGSFTFYDSLLPHVAAPEERDRVSSAGFALGYLGGGLLLAFGLALIQFPGWFGLPSGEGLTPAQATLPVRLSFVIAALWWFVFALPVLRRVPEPAAAPRPAGRSLVRETAGQLARTFHELRRYRDASIFLLAFLIYNDGIGTIIRLAAIYGKEIGITESTLIGSILLTQFVGVPFAILFGRLAGRIGAKQAIYIALAVYAGISVLGFFVRTDLHFVALACLVGTVQGGAQALSRSLFSSMIPKSKSGEFFGFYAVFEKGAAILGPLVFWIALATTGSSRNAILSIILFFVTGALLLTRVDIARGQATARDAEAELSRAAA